MNYFMLVWFGVQFVRQGIYQGGIFRFNITLPQNFPDGGCPVRLYFLTHNILTMDYIRTQPYQYNYFKSILESCISNSSFSSFN